MRRLPNSLPDLTINELIDAFNQYAHDVLNSRTTAEGTRHIYSDISGLTLAVFGSARELEMTTSGQSVSSHDRSQPP